MRNYIEMFCGGALITSIILNLIKYNLIQEIWQLLCASILMIGLFIKEGK